jgi:hypothetical protein
MPFQAAHKTERVKIVRHGVAAARIDGTPSWAQLVLNGGQSAMGKRGRSCRSQVRAKETSSTNEIYVPGVVRADGDRLPRCCDLLCACTGVARMLACEVYTSGPSIEQNPVKLSSMEPAYS